MKVKKIIAVAKNPDTHTRITIVNQNVVVLGGNEKTHEKATKKVLKNLP
jgi:hypothetical protein